MGVMVKNCPFCGVGLVGGERDNSDNAGEFFYYHPESDCFAYWAGVGVWPHNLDAWNTRAPSSFEIDRQCRREIEGRQDG